MRRCGQATYSSSQCGRAARVTTPFWVKGLPAGQRTPRAAAGREGGPAVSDGSALQPFDPLATTNFIARVVRLACPKPAVCPVPRGELAPPRRQASILL